MVGKWHPEGGSRANPEPSRFQIPSLCLRCTGSNLPLPLSRAFEPLVKQASPRCLLFKVCVCSNHRPHSRAEHATPELGVCLGLGWSSKPEEGLCRLLSGTKAPSRMQLRSPDNQPSGWQGHSEVWEPLLSGISSMLGSGTYLTYRRLHFHFMLQSQTHWGI